MYLARTLLPRKVRLDKALCLVYGLGEPTSKKIYRYAGVQGCSRMRKLSGAQKKRIKDEFALLAGPYGKQLSNLDKERCQNLIDIQSYRGRRHKFGYPVRGQRTHTNARTQKRLHKRWSSLAYEKPRISGKQIKATKDSKIAKNKKSKTLTKAKPKKTVVQKAAKYKIS